MAKLKFKSNGKWESIAAFQGEPGKDGAIQYTAGEGIKIENDTISAEVTKQYVDNAIGGIEIPESDSKLAVNFVEISGGRWVTKSETGYDYDWHPIQSHNTDAFDKAIKNTKYNSTIFIKVLLSSMEVLFHSKLPLRTTWTSYQMTGIDAYSGGSMNFYTFTLSVSWDGETPTVTGTSNLNRYNITGVKAQNVLVKANTTEYTPTGDYNPATKKYVDDSIAAIDVSGGSDEPEFIELEGWFETISYTAEKSKYSYNSLTANDRQTITNFVNKYWDGNKFTKPLIFKTSRDFHYLSGWTTGVSSGGVSLITFYLQPKIYTDTSGVEKYTATRNRFTAAFKGDLGAYTPEYSSSLTHWWVDSYSEPVLHKNNYVPYTPTGDYNPATKKYVDDAIAALRAELGGE